MQKTIIGIVVATIVLYMWGFLYWGFSTLPYSSWKQTPNDEAAQEILAEHFPESGTYFVPGMQHEVEERARLLSAGPNGFVHIRHGGQTVPDPTVLIGGFVLTIVIVCLLAGFFRIAGATEFRDFARLSLAAGVVAVVVIDVGDIVWWQTAFSWKIWQIIYDFSVWLIAGHVLGFFMKRETAEAAS